MITPTVDNPVDSRYGASVTRTPLRCRNGVVTEARVTPRNAVTRPDLPTKRRYATRYGTPRRTSRLGRYVTSVTPWGDAHVTHETDAPA